MRSSPNPEIIAAPWFSRASTRRLIKVLETAGHQVRFVGGSVRDALIGRFPPKPDVDLATTADPAQVISCLHEAGIKALPTGVAHGTVTAIVDQDPFEITTLREDVATDGRHAAVRFTIDFERDAARRDFTFNALSVDAEGHLFDPFQGHRDLLDGRVRFVGPPDIRIAEDYLRILRLFRFHAYFGKLRPAPDALAACAAAAGKLETLSGERVAQEMLKLLRAPSPQPSLDLMVETGVAAQAFAGLQTLPNLNPVLEVERQPDPLLRLAFLVRSAPGPLDRARRLSSRWRLSNREADRLERLVDGWRQLPQDEKNAASQAMALGEQQSLLVLVYRLGLTLAADLMRLEAGRRPAPLIRARIGALEDLTIPPFPLTGDDLLTHGFEPGPGLGEALAKTEAWWLSQSGKPDRDACLAFAQKQ